eukprot:TRINITY_DN17880_c0_g1_i1.p1 TRINITY_DN17880_c0_g1~~TRINITY_DN17880_c0_g1_i1.p1  ORF type:complete len:223 (-),score=29.22 TRINITY_DN17880_c0_g1_i1:30-605(-)
MLQKNQWAVRPSVIFPWARWVTPPFLAKRADTFFYIVVLPSLNSLPPLSPSLRSTAQTTEEPEDEVSELLWLTPSEALARSVAGRLPMTPPTIYVLHQLNAFRHVEEVLDASASQDLLPNISWTCFTEDDEVFFVFPGDSLHQLDQQDLHMFPASTPPTIVTTPESRHRMVRDGHSWKLITNMKHRITAKL